ncbi:MAG: type I 3-dehydroquinate dehydratase [Deltaproteobacteria bacterium]|nr:type I 3-dehydroquinate dehydratase [Deltaproteobacteria bacterium]
MFCIPIIASSTEEAVKRMKEAAKVADVLEVRLDLMDSFDIPALVRAAGKPVIITWRSEKEGGKRSHSPEKVAGYLISAIEAGADFVDVELSLPQEIRKMITNVSGKSQIIVSSHITAGTPSLEELESVLRKSIAVGGDIIKIVPTAREWYDNIRVLELVKLAKKENVRIISFCMGKLGRLSRIFSLPMGAYMTFASMEPGQESADGQITINKMKEIMDFFSI